MSRHGDMIGGAGAASSGSSSYTGAATGGSGTGPVHSAPMTGTAASELTTREKQLTDILKSIHDSKDSLIREVANEDIVIFLGNSKGGKSTVVNFIIGNKLTAIKNIVTKKMSLIKEHDAQGPIIGESSLSETTIPTKWSSTLIPQAIWDAPGFDDNRGVTCDVPNAFFIRELLSHAKSVKFVLVSDIDNLYGDNIKPFIDSLNRVHTLLPDIEILAENISVIFTKVRPGELNRDEISELLQNKFITPVTVEDVVYPIVELASPLKKLVQHWVENKEKAIGIFNNVAKHGPINPADVDDRIIQSILETASADRSKLGHVHLGLSSESCVFLIKSHDELCQMPEFDKILSKVEKFYLDEIKTVVDQINLGKMSDDQLKKAGEALDKYAEIINGLVNKPKSNLVDILKELAKPSREITDKLEKSEISAKISAKEKFIAFIEESLRLNHTGIFINKVKEAGASIITELGQAQIHVLVKLGEVTTSQANELKTLYDQQHQAISEEIKEATKRLEQSNKEKADAQLTLLKGAGYVGGGALTAAVIPAAAPILTIIKGAKALHGDEEAKKDVAGYGAVTAMLLAAGGVGAAIASLVAAPIVVGGAVGVGVFSLIGGAIGAIGAHNSVQEAAKQANEEAKKALAGVTAKAEKIKKEIEAAELKAKEAGEALAKAKADALASGDSRAIKTLQKEDEKAKKALADVTAKAEEIKEEKEAAELKAKETDEALARALSTDEAGVDSATAMGAAAAVVGASTTDTPAPAVTTYAAVGGAGTTVADDTPPLGGTCAAVHD